MNYYKSNYYHANYFSWKRILDTAKKYIGLVANVGRLLRK